MTKKKPLKRKCGHWKIGDFVYSNNKVLFKIIDSKIYEWSFQKYRAEYPIGISARGKKEVLVIYDGEEFRRPTKDELINQINFLNEALMLIDDEEIKEMEYIMNLGKTFTEKSD